MTVSDHGPGVPAPERERIFERFQRGSTSGGRSGFGLGLAIGRELATRMGGSLELRTSEPAPERTAWRVLCPAPAGAASASG